MSTPGYIVTSYANYWIRVNLALELHLKQALLDILHNFDNDVAYQGLPTDSKQLYARMDKFRKSAQGKKLAKKVIRKDQWDVLCNPSKVDSDSQEWDITLIVVVISNVLRLPASLSGWANFPVVTDLSKAAFVLRVRYLRNKVIHSSLKVFTLQQFQNVWQEIEDALSSVNYSKMKELKELQSEDLEFYTPAVVNFLKNKCNNLEKTLHQYNMSQNQLSTRLQKDLDSEATARELAIDCLNNEMQDIKNTFSTFVDACHQNRNLETQQMCERLRQLERTIATTVNGQGKYEGIFSIRCPGRHH